jgi:hypothetical protein
MTRNKDLREFAERYKEEPGKKPGGPVKDEEPRIVEGTDPRAKTSTNSPVIAVPRKCKVHRTKIEGINYHCHECGSVFCLACIANVLMPEGKCMVCEATVTIDDEFRAIIERASRNVEPDAYILSGQVTTISPEIWRRFEELQLDEDVVDEVIDRLKYVPPEDRLKYLNAYFNDEEQDDDHL